MANADDVRRIALALPGVEEIESDGFDFRVGGHGFVWSYPNARPGQPRVIRPDIAVLFVGDEAEKQALLLGEPGIFFTAPGYDGRPLVMLRLAQVDAGWLEELVTDAWRMRAKDPPAAEIVDALLDVLCRETEPHSLREVPTFAADDLGQDLRWELERLRSAGIRQVVAVDLTRPDFAIPVVRVVIPGLEGDIRHPHYVPGLRADRVAALSR